MAADVTVSKEVNAPPETVWGMIADLPRMGEWSPETEGGEWIGGATGPAPGAKFRGSNRHGKKAWKTVARVVDADPGRRFSFLIKVGIMPVAEWAYDIEATDSGCRVTESWTDRRPGFFKPIAAKATGVTDRVVHNQATMEQTLERLASAAEAATTAG
jgi:uncharacterized protein YndB with AHSA1/START domain